MTVLNEGSKEQKELKAGLGKWVNDFRDARKGDVKLAKEIKANIDAVIKAKGLDAKIIYGDKEKMNYESKNYKDFMTEASGYVVGPKLMPGVRRDLEQYFSKLSKANHVGVPMDAIETRLNAHGLTAVTDVDVDLTVDGEAEFDISEVGSGGKVDDGLITLSVVWNFFDNALSAKDTANDNVADCKCKVYLVDASDSATIEEDINESSIDSRLEQGALEYVNKMTGIRSSALKTFFDKNKIEALKIAELIGTKDVGAKHILDAMFNDDKKDVKLLHDKIKKGPGKQKRERNSFGAMMGIKEDCITEALDMRKDEDGSEIYSEKGTKGKNIYAAVSTKHSGIVWVQADTPVKAQEVAIQVMKKVKKTHEIKVKFAQEA